MPEDISTFYEKMDHEEEDAEEEASKVVSFEVNQVLVNVDLLLENNSLLGV